LTEEIPAQRLVAAIVPRHEIMGALEDPEAQPELLLQIASDGDDEVRTVGMAWSRDELEKLLERVPGDDIKLTFDRDELSQAVADVEAHGLRERALVFAVAATGVLGTGTAIANAMPTTADAGGAAVTSIASSADSMVTDASSAGGYAAPAAVGSAADSMVTDASSAGGYAAPAAAGSAADSMFTDASSAGGYAAPAAAGSAADSLLTDASSAGGYAAPAATGSAADSLLTDVSSGGGYGPVAVDSGSGQFLGIQAPSSTDGLLVGGVLLAIAGATFVGRRTGGTARPA
jgi:hypothetical protein